MRAKITKIEEELVQPPVETSSVPAFSETQRLAVREAQFQSTKLREQSRQLVEQAQHVDQQIANFINRAAAELKVDPKKYGFNIDTLTFYPVEK